MAKVVNESSQNAPVYEQQNFQPQLFEVPSIDLQNHDDMTKFSESIVNFGLLSGKLICITFANARQSFMGKVDSIVGNELKLVSTNKEIEAKPILLTKGTTIELLQRGQKYGYMELLAASSDGRFHGRPVKALGPAVGRLLHGLPVKGEWERKDGKVYFGEVKMMKDLNAKGRKIFTDTNERTPAHIENVLAELKAVGFDNSSFDFLNKENGIRLTESASIFLRGDKGATLNVMESSKDYKDNPDKYHNALLIVQEYIVRNKLQLPDLEEKIQKEKYRLGVKIDDKMWEEIKNNPKGVRVDFEFTNKLNKKVEMPGRLYIDPEMNQLKHRFLSEQEINFEEKQSAKVKIEDAVVVNEGNSNSTPGDAVKHEREEYVAAMIEAVKELKNQGYKEAWFDIKNRQAGIAIDGKKTSESQGYFAYVRFKDMENLKGAHLIVQDLKGAEYKSITPEVGHRIDKALDITKKEIKKHGELVSQKETESKEKSVKNSSGVRV